LNELIKYWQSPEATASPPEKTNENPFLSHLFAHLKNATKISKADFLAYY
jgi:hypothetical protein